MGKKHILTHGDDGENGYYSDVKKCFYRIMGIVLGENNK